MTDTPDQSTIEAAERLLEQAKAGEIVGIAWCTVGPDDVAYGLCGEVITGGLGVLGALRLMEDKLISMFNAALEQLETEEP